MAVNRFVAGQRWLSQTEPELGLGLVLKVEPDRVNIVFPSSETTRVYTIENPPLTRVSFSVGDVLKTQEGKEFTVEDLIDKDGLVTYINKGKKIEESRLSDSLTFSKPFDRLLNAQVDEKPVYNLRHRALYRRFKTLRAPLRGFFSGRYNPRPHQLYVAVQAVRQAHPRVLLADEPGMGKTVEAGLILQRLRTFGNADRVLLLAPEALLDNVELELRRRFGQTFTRLSAEDFAGVKTARKTAKKTTEEASAANPFGAPDEEIWESCTLEDLAGGRGKRSAAAAEAGWDVVVVAGGESLEWTEEGGNAAWTAVEPLA
ncbi:MAG: RNA polymerase-binding ATPase, partial [Verrucomicrobiaceae bacterium]